MVPLVSQETEPLSQPRMPGLHRCRRHHWCWRGVWTSVTRPDIPELWDSSLTPPTHPQLEIERHCVTWKEKELTCLHLLKHTFQPHSPKSYFCGACFLTHPLATVFSVNQVVPSPFASLKVAPWGRISAKPPVPASAAN